MFWPPFTSDSWTMLTVSLTYRDGNVSVRNSEGSSDLWIGEQDLSLRVTPLGDLAVWTNAGKLQYCVNNNK